MSCCWGCRCSARLGSHGSFGAKEGARWHTGRSAHLLRGIVLTTGFTRMLALSIVAPNGANIAAGRKTLEIRSWRPPQWPLRNLLIIENRIFLTGLDEVDPDGVAVAIVDVVDVRPWQPSELAQACASQWTADMWAWQVACVRPLRQRFKIAARRKLYEVAIDDALIGPV